LTYAVIEFGFGLVLIIVMGFLELESGCLEIVKFQVKFTLDLKEDFLFFVVVVVKEPIDIANGIESIDALLV